MADKTRITAADIDGSKLSIKVFGKKDGDNPAPVLHTLDTDVATYPQDTILMLAAFGLARVGQSAYHGQTSDPEEAYHKVREALAKVEKGEWTPGVSARESEPDELVAAAMRVYGVPRDKAEAQIGTLSAVEKRQARLHPRIMKAIADIRAEKAKAAAKGADKGARDVLGGLFADDAQEAAQ